MKKKDQKTFTKFYRKRTYKMICPKEEEGRKDSESGKLKVKRKRISKFENKQKP